MRSCKQAKRGGRIQSPEQLYQIKKIWEVNNMWAILWKTNLVYCTWGSISAKLSDHEEHSAGSCAYLIDVTCQSNLIPLVYSPRLPGKVTSNSRPHQCLQTAEDSHTQSPHLQYNFQTSRWKSWFIICTELGLGVVLFDKDKQNRQADFPDTFWYPA